MRDVDVVKNNAGTFSWINAKKGRQVIKTEYLLDGSTNDTTTIKKILKESLPIHESNVTEIDRLFSIFYNNQEIETKVKTQRGDINNKIGVPTGYIISRAINGYCFGSPIKFVAKNTEKQKSVEELSEFLESANNHKAIVTSTYFSSICGVGYKLVLPRLADDIDDTPFKISGNLFPQNCFVVKSNTIMPEDVLGVIISSYREDGKDIECYECYSKYYQYRFIKDSNDENGFRSLGFKFNDQQIDGFPLMAKQIPLIEVPRNPFRIGDWELITDLFHAKNLLLSNRQDDIQQVVDYLLVLTNCTFSSEEEKNEILKSRLLQLSVSNVGAKASVDILKNPLDQNGVQLMQNYIDNLIEECAGIPNRAERSGSGQDTGRAVIFKSGFRDLENNAGLIVPEMEDAEKKSIKLCLSYCKNLNNDNLMKDLKLRNITIKFSRTLTDDIVGSATAYSTLVNAGMDEVDALVASKIVDDPAEVGERAKKRTKEKLEEEKAREQVTQIIKQENKGGVTNGN